MKLALKIVAGIVGLLVVVVAGFLVYTNTKSPPDFSSTPKPAIVASTDPAVIARGEYVANAVAHCWICHVPVSEEDMKQRKITADVRDLRGGRVMKAGPFGTFYPANLTSDKETGIGAVDDATLARAIRHGVARDGSFAAFMRLAVGPMSDEDLTAVVSYLRTIPPAKNAVPRDEWGIIAKVIQDNFAPRTDAPPVHVPEGGVSVERGKYLANGPALCVGCHTPADPMKGFAMTGAPFSGVAEADPDFTDDAYEIVAPNLTPHPTTGIMTNWTEDAFLARFRAGPAYKGSKMPWESFAKMTDDDVRSIYRYLKTLPPADHDVGPSHRLAGSWKKPD